jgi:hypothetical protein
VLEEDGSEQTLSFAELSARSNQVANGSGSSASVAGTG